MVLLLAVLLLGGVLLWREQRQRDAVERSVETSLARVEFLQQQERYDDAVVVLDVVERQLESRGLATLHARFKQRKRDVEMLMRLEKAYLQTAATGRRGADVAGADRLYAEAFARYDLDVITLSPEESAERVRISAICTHLIAALDHWSYLKEGWQSGAGGPLRAVVDMADQDRWRRRLRETAAREAAAQRAARRGDERSLERLQDELERLAEAEGVWNQSPVHLVLLSLTLGNTGNNAAAERLLRRAQSKHPADFWINFWLAVRLESRGKPLNGAEAVGFLRAALALRPRSPLVYFQLGSVFMQQGKLAEAEAAYRNAVILQPDFAMAHSSLGNTCLQQKKLAEAEAAIREAADLNSEYAVNYSALGQAYREKGQFTKALTHYRRGHELTAKNRDWHYSFAHNVKECEHLVALEAQLPRVLMGEIQPPTDVNDRLTLACVCLEFKSLHAAAVRFYADAFATEPKLVDHLPPYHRYNAARAAALAGCGQGKDADQSDDKERGRLRNQAIGLLRADLAAYRRLLDKELDQAGPAVHERMRHWQQDKDFTGVRGSEALAKLPEAERLEWQKLWQEVEALRKRAALSPKPAKPGGP